MKRRTVLLGAGGLAAMAVTGWAAWRNSSRSAPAANRAAGALGAQTPATQPNPRALFDARLPGLDGHEFALQALTGQPLVVNFWATWCAPCVQELPYLNSMAKELPNIKFVGIGGGFEYGDCGNTHYLLEDVALTRLFPNFKSFFPINGENAASLLEKTYHLYGPTYYRIGKNGKSNLDDKIKSYSDSGIEIISENNNISFLDFLIKRSLLK